MSRSKKDRKGVSLDHQDMGLLGAAFNLPTRRNIELAERRAAVAAAQTPRHVKVSYKGGKDTRIDTFETSSSSDDDDDDDCEEDDYSELELLGARQRQSDDTCHERRDSSVLRKSERQATRQQQPSTQSSKRKKLTKSRSLSANSTKAFSPPVAPLVSPSATFPSFRRSAIAASSRSLEQYRQPRAAFVPATDLGVSSAQMMRRAPPAIALPHPVIAPARALPSGIVAQQIQKIQAEIDSKVALLSRDASDGALRDDLTALQIKLNSTLNSMMDAKKKSTRQTSPEMAEEQSPLLKHQLDYTSRDSRVSKRDESPERALRHHLCSGCGHVRSSKFHDKHPIATGGKPILNYCKSCQGKTAGDVEETRLQQYHFCFGCGIVRSKKFQRKNPRNDVDGSALPNYCGKCTQEIQSFVGIAEASAVMDLDNQDEEESLGTCSVAVHASSDITPEAASPQTQSEFSLDTAEFPEPSLPPSQISRKRNKYGLSQGKRRVAVKPRNLTQSSPPPRDPTSLNPPPSTPYRYLPDRRSGSAQRRAQRSPLASVSGSGTFGPICADNDPAQPYRAPYVEDVPSPETKQPRSKHRTSSQYSFERVSVPQTYKKRQTCGAKGETNQDIFAAEAARKAVKSKAYREVHFWDSPLSGEISFDEDFKEESTESDGAQRGQNQRCESPEMVEAKKPRSQFQGVQQSPAKKSKFKNPTHVAQDLPIGEAPKQQGSTTRFWKGAFAKRERGEAGAWANHIPAASERQASPSSPSHSAASSFSSSFAARHSTRSAPSPPEPAGLSVFPPSIHDPFIPPASIGQDEDAPPLRTSKGAFGSSAFKAPPFFKKDMFGETRPSSPLDSRSKSKAQKFSHLRDGSDNHSGAKSSLGPTSGFAGFGCKFDSECFTVRDEDGVPLVHGYGDFSQLCGGGGSSSSGYPQNYCPNPNPYYIPRKSTLADPNYTNSSGFRRRPCRFRAGDWFGDSKSWASKRTTPEWIPEPIIEEPSSPMSSPVQCAMLLEFHNHSGTAFPVPPLSEASTESTEPDILEISDIE